MSLRKKLTLGLGFLFLIIFVLVFLCSYYVGRSAHDAENILKNNYQSLAYSKNMISALEDMRTAVTSIVFNPAAARPPSDYYLKRLEAGRTEFESNLKSENGNITEINEREYVTELNQGYALYAGLCARVAAGEGSPALYFGEFQPASENLRNAVTSINDINMQAVERKSQLTRRHSGNVIRLMAGVGTFCLVLALGYFWYFPYYISNSIAYLSDRMRELLNKSGIVLNIRTNDETYVLLEGINLLGNRPDLK